MALQGQMPLNLPENALLDGLFTSGLGFVSTYPGLAAGSGRLATARYEMLHLTEEGHRLLPPIGGNRHKDPYFTADRYLPLHIVILIFHDRIGGMR